jgi:RND family efflux transporter MFP subunit
MSSFAEPEAVKTEGEASNESEGIGVGAVAQNERAARSQFQKHCQDWLATQCTLSDGVYSALLAVREDELQFMPVAIWPAVQLVEPEALSAAVEEAAASSQPLIRSMPNKSGRGEVFVIAFPVLEATATASPTEFEAQVHTVVAMAVTVASREQLQKNMELLTLGVASLQLLRLQHDYQTLSIHNGNLSAGVSMLAKVLSEPRYNAAVNTFIAELAVSLDCDRVSLGFQHNRSSQLTHISHSSQFGKKMNLVRCIEKAMDESIDQRQVICFSVSDDVAPSVISSAHQTLADSAGSRSVMTLPIQLMAGQESQTVESFAALCFERFSGKSFDINDLTTAESISALLMPALQDKRANDRGIFYKLREAAAKPFIWFMGPQQLGRKLLLLAALSLLIFFTFATSDYRLSTKARATSESQRQLTVPYDGYLLEASVRAGDVVSQGDTLFTLDDKDLRLEKLKWLGETAKLKAKHQEALASKDRAGQNIISAQQDQAAAQLQLIELQLARSSVTAPFTGLVVSGDLSQRFGTAVKKGETLFALAPLNRFRIDLLVPEERIADVKVGQSGELFLSALPEQGFQLEIVKLIPVTTSLDGASYYTVEAELIGPAEKIQPGMEGVAKVDIDERLLIGIWSRGLVDWYRVTFWSWWG